MNIKIQRNFKRTLMKGLIVLILGMVGKISWGQNSLNSGDFSGGSWGSGQLMSASAGTSLIITKGVSTSGDKFFRFFGDGTPCGEYQPNSNGDAFISGTVVTTPNSNCGNSNAWKINVPSSSSNVVFKTDGNNTGISKSIAFVVQGAVNTFSSHTAPTSSTVYPGLTRRLTVTASGIFSTGQSAYIRYHNGAGFGNATITELTYSGSSNDYYVDIPTSTNSSGSTISYYFFSSGSVLTISNSDADFYSINLLNNGGSNYSYTVSANWTTTSGGNWSSLTWNGGTLPSNVPVNIAHNVTLDQDATVSSLTINSGTFTASDNTPRTLTITKSATGNSTTLANSGTWANGVGGSTVTFTGAPSSGDAIHNVTGTIAFRNVIINKTSGSSNVGAFFNAGQTLTNSIEIGTGGYVSEDVANFYGASTTLIFNQGTGANYDVNNADNTWPNSNPAPNITVNSGTVTINTARFVTAGGTLTVASGATLASGGNLTIKSDATGTASIGNSAGSISGNVIVERYVSGAGRRWRFLSSPVQSATVANWMSQFYVTGPDDGTTTTSTTLGSAMPITGWHCSKANQDYPNTNYPSAPSNVRSVKTTSIRTYNESASGNSTNLNAGWENLSGTSQALTAGQGFRVFVRGAIGNTGQLDGSVILQSAVTLALSGTVNQGNVTPTLTNSTQGWNLLGNPYACGYDFNAQYDAVQGIANINPTVYVYDATTNGYVSYNASSNTPSGLASGVIPSGAGFFIQASGAPTFQFREAYKTTAVNPTAVHKTDISTVDFGIKYYKDSTENDYMVVKMFDGATTNNEIFDTKKVYNENLNLSAYGIDSVQLTASCIPFVTSETRIKLNVEATAIATYTFDFKNMDNFQSNITVSLFDRYTNKTTDVRKNTKYTFDMGAGVNQWGKNRFELILNLDKTNVDEFALLNQTHMLVYPNPATDVLNINISNSSFKNSDVVVYNISGTEVLKTNMANSTAQLNIESLSNGVYFVKVSNENGFSKTVKFVK